MLTRRFDGREPHVVASRDGTQFPSDWRRDGSALLVTEETGGNKHDIFVQPADGSTPRIFAATADSGEPTLNTTGGVTGSSLESSNTDISEEFTKLIVTQQAYAAGTKIVTTANDMLQQALNMLR